MPQDENPQIPSDMDLVFPELDATPEYPMTLPELDKTDAMEEAPPGTGPASMPSFDVGGTSFMSGLTSAMANIGGIAGALGAGGPQAMTNFVNKLTERQNLELSQSWAAYQKQQERDHQKERDEQQRAHEMALVQKKWELEGGKELRQASNLYKSMLDRDPTGSLAASVSQTLNLPPDLSHVEIAKVMATQFGSNAQSVQETLQKPLLAEGAIQQLFTQNKLPLPKARDAELANEGRALKASISKIDRLFKGLQGASAVATEGMDKTKSEGAERVTYFTSVGETLQASLDSFSGSIGGLDDAYSNLLIFGSTDGSIGGSLQNEYKNVLDHAEAVLKRTKDGITSGVTSDTGANIVRDMREGTLSSSLLMTADKETFDQVLGSQFIDDADDQLQRIILTINTIRKADPYNFSSNLQEALGRNILSSDPLMKIWTDYTEGGFDAVNLPILLEQAYKTLRGKDSTLEAPLTKSFEETNAQLQALFKIDSRDLLENDSQRKVTENNAVKLDSIIRQVIPAATGNQTDFLYSGGGGPLSDVITSFAGLVGPGATKFAVQEMQDRMAQQFMNAGLMSQKIDVSIPGPGGGKKQITQQVFSPEKFLGDAWVRRNIAHAFRMRPMVPGIRDIATQESVLQKALEHSHLGKENPDFVDGVMKEFNDIDRPFYNSTPYNSEAIGRHDVPSFFKENNSQFSMSSDAVSRQQHTKNMFDGIRRTGVTPYSRREAKSRVDAWKRLRDTGPSGTLYQQAMGKKPAEQDVIWNLDDVVGLLASGSSDLRERIFWSTGGYASAQKLTEREGNLLGTDVAHTPTGRYGSVSPVGLGVFSPKYIGRTRAEQRRLRESLGEPYLEGERTEWLNITEPGWGSDPAAGTYGGISEAYGRTAPIEKDVSPQWQRGYRTFENTEAFGEHGWAVDPTVRAMVLDIVLAHDWVHDPSASEEAIQTGLAIQDRIKHMADSPEGREEIDKRWIAINPSSHIGLVDPTGDSGFSNDEMFPDALLAAAIEIPRGDAEPGTIVGKIHRNSVGGLDAEGIEGSRRRLKKEQREIADALDVGRVSGQLIDVGRGAVPVIENFTVARATQRGKEIDKYLATLDVHKLAIDNPAIMERGLAYLATVLITPDEPGGANGLTSIGDLVANLESFSGMLGITKDIASTEASRLEFVKLRFSQLGDDEPDYGDVLPILADFLAVTGTNELMAKSPVQMDAQQRGVLSSRLKSEVNAVVEDMYSMSTSPELRKMTTENVRFGLQRYLGDDYDELLTTNKQNDLMKAAIWLKLATLREQLEYHKFDRKAGTSKPKAKGSLSADSTSSLIPAGQE